MRDYIKWLFESPSKIGELMVVGGFLLLMPGQNYFQTLVITPQPPQIFEIDIPEPLSFPTPVKVNDINDVWISAKSAIVYDTKSMSVLYELHPDKQMLPASTTKIMTAMVALDEYDLNEVVTVVDENRSVGHVAELYAGEQLKVQDLVKAMMINSGNDAALALAQYHPQGYDYFVGLMNAKAHEYHMNNSHFSNVSGLENTTHYVSSRDMVLLTKEAMKNDYFASVVETKQTEISSIDGRYKHQLQNLNVLLGNVEGMVGVKTGWTPLAGDCLVTQVERNGRTIVTVILNSQDRFADTRRLIEWVFESYEWID